MLNRMWQWVFGPTAEVHRETPPETHARPYYPRQLTRSTPEYRTSHSVVDARREYNRDSYAYNMCNSLARWAGTIEVIFTGPDAEYLKGKLAEWRPVPNAPKLDWDELIEYCYLRLVRDGNAVDELVAMDGRAYLKEINPVYLRDTAVNLTVGGVQLGSVSQGVHVDDLGRPLGYVVNPVGTAINNPLKDTGIRYIPANRVVHIFKRTQEDTTVGSPMISRSLPAFEALRDIENELLACYQRALGGGLIFKTPDYMLPIYLRLEDGQGMPINPTVSDEMDADTAAALLQFRADNDATGDRVISKDVVVEPRPVAELPDGASLEAVKELLIQRAARGGDVSPSAVQASFGSQGYLSANFAVATDYRTYQGLQRLGLVYAQSVFEFWAMMMTASDPEFSRAMSSTAYTFTASKIPSANRGQEVVVIRELLAQGVISKAEAARMFGLDYDRMREEIGAENGSSPDLQ